MEIPLCSCPHLLHCHHFHIPLHPLFALGGIGVAEVQGRSQYYNITAGGTVGRGSFPPPGLPWCPSRAGGGSARRFPTLSSTSPYTLRREFPLYFCAREVNTIRLQFSCVAGGGSPTNLPHQCHDVSVGGMQVTPPPGPLHSPGTSPLSAGGSVILVLLPSSAACKMPPPG